MNYSKHVTQKYVALELDLLVDSHLYYATTLGVFAGTQTSTVD